MDKYETHDAVCPTCSKEWQRQLEAQGITYKRLPEIIEECLDCLGTYMRPIPMAEVVYTRRNGRGMADELLK